MFLLEIYEEKLIIWAEFIIQIFSAETDLRHLSITSTVENMVAEGYENDIEELKRILKISIPIDV